MTHYVLTKDPPPFNLNQTNSNKFLILPINGTGMDTMNPSELVKPADLIQFLNPDL